jgi:drug/metabolite transporter (DMT)-like permease
VLLLFTPPFTMLLDSAIQGTRITLHLIGGMVLIIAGACVIIVGHDRRQRFMFIDGELDS